MNIQTVIDNLDRTIRGKEMLRGELARRTIYNAVVEIVQANIDELTKIRADLITVHDNSLLDFV